MLHRDALSDLPSRSSTASHSTGCYVVDVAAQAPGWGRFAVAQAVAWTAGVVGVGVFALREATLGGQQRWMPSLEALPWVMVVLALLSCLLLVGWMVVRRPLRGARRRRLTATVWVLGQVAASAASTAAVAAADPELFFGPRLVDRLAVPSGNRTAYLFKTGFFCDYELYVRETGSVVLNHVRNVAQTDCGARSEDAHLQWRETEGVVLLDEPGDLVTSQPYDFSGLWLGPH